MGSITAYEVSEEDKLLFRTLASRASGFIQRARTLAAERAARAELERHVAARRDAEEELERAALFRDRLLAIVGHDLRNPLGAVRLGAGLIAKRASTPADAAAAERIARSAARMERIIADLVDVAGTRFGEGLALSRRRVDAGEVVRHVVEEHQLTHPDRSVRLEVRGDASAELDPDRFAQVVANLVSNALAHGSADAPVSVTVRGEDRELSLEVHNEGAPIPPEVVPELFQPFRRGRRDPAQGRGLGLGLFIVSEIVRAHGGDVSVRSSEGGGTTFTVRLPRGARGWPDQPLQGSLARSAATMARVELERFRV